MDGSQRGHEVQLHGEQRGRVTQAASDVQSSLNALAGVIAEVMEIPVDQDTDVESARLVSTHGASTLIVHGPEYCWVYDGVQMVYRPCTPEDEVQAD
jgi:hypothetical protein